MRELRYSVAATLDGFIAGPKGEFDWIPMDPDIDFGALYARFSAIVMGRRTYDLAASMGASAPPWPVTPVYVYSRTLREGERKGGVTVVRDAAPHVRQLKEADGKPIWLFGGGELFAALAGEGLVDGVDVSITPVILGRGLPLAPLTGGRLSLELRGHRVYGKSGIVSLEYDVRRQ